MRYFLTLTLLAVAIYIAVDSGDLIAFMAPVGLSAMLLAFVVNDKRARRGQNTEEDENPNYCHCNCPRD